MRFASGGTIIILLNLDQKPPQLISSAVTCKTAPVHFMTTTATVAGSRGLAIARVLFDHGWQVSFLAANLAERVGAKCPRSRKIELAAFGIQQSVSNVHEYELGLMGLDVRPHKVTALKRSRLDLRIPPVAPSTIQRRQQYGIVVGDRCDTRKACSIQQNMIDALQTCHGRIGI